MGLIRPTSPLVAPAPKGVIDPSTGKPVGADDPFFLKIDEELADKGFIVTAADERKYGKHYTYAACLALLNDES